MMKGKKSSVIVSKTKDMHTLRVETAKKWYERIWVIISNPFSYIITGVVRY